MDDQDLQWRPATPADGPRLCQLFAAITMESDLHLAVERDPDFFGLYDMQRAEPFPFVLVQRGEIEGLALLSARDGWLGGERRRVGYAGDLRFTGKVRGGRILRRFFAPVLGDGARRLGADLFYTVIITSNRRAVAALTRRSERYPDVPIYTPFCDFRITNVQYTVRKRPRPTGLEVRPAVDGDLPAIAALLGAEHRRAPFGYVVDEALLRQRLDRWPGLSVGDFYLAFDGSALVGVAATWDANAVKRYRVLAYRRSMRWIRLGFNAAATLGRFGKLPPAGGLMRYFYLTHVAVPSQRPEVMAALLDRIYAQNYGRGYHFFSACVLQDDPLAPAYRRFRTTDLPATLYTLSLPGVPVPIDALRDGRPGFEMALV